MNRTELMDLLSMTKSETLHFFDLNDLELSKTYGEGKWSIRQILHHLTDVEYLFIGRLKTIIAEPGKVIWAFDQDEWNLAFNYISAPLHGKREIFSLAREMNKDLVTQFYDELGHREFVHSRTGLRTLKMEFEKVALHNRNHNEQIKLALSL
jgi:uncharacterized damage-inducible protein DinB